MNKHEVNRLGIQILERWASEAGFDVQTQRTARVSIDGDESRLAIVKATTVPGFRVVEPEYDSGSLIHVRIGKEDGGTYPETEIAVLDVHTAWDLANLASDFDPNRHDSYHWNYRSVPVEAIVQPLTARTPLELGDLLAAVR
ncbi:hypothetical protein Br6_05018 [Rhodococcus sp. Br-6]|nr:hypothetical protein Br6_05018 [Rhodococcus sp. Br-6]